MKDKNQSERSIGGNNFELKIYRALRNDETLDISKIKHKKRFYYSEQTVQEMIAKELKADKNKYTTAQLKKRAKKMIKNYIDANNSCVIRSKTKFYKEADVSFMTNKKYLYNGKLTGIRFIIDSTTTARNDRIKGKAQDSSVYKKLGFPFISLIVLPDDDYLTKYKNPEKEMKQCESAVYDANFCNAYKNDGVSLIVRENELYKLLHYVNKNEEKDINKIIERWKNKTYKDLAIRRKNDVNNYIEKTANDVLKILGADL